MIHLDKRISQPIKIPFVEATNQTGVVAFTIALLKDGEVYIGITPTYDEIGGGVYTCELTFTETGVYTVVLQDDIAAIVNVVEKEAYTILQDLDDVAQGSWVYDKAEGTLTLLRQSGDEFAVFNVVDDVNVSSREKV